MVGKTIGRTIDERPAPGLRRALRQHEGRDLRHRRRAAQGARATRQFEKLPTGALGLYTYYERLAQGLRQLMAGSRKFACSYISRDDLCALTREAAAISGIN